MYALAIALCGFLFFTHLPAYGAAIGVAVAGGSFRVDDSMVTGNATLFDGSRLETVAASSEVRLTGGVHLRLAAGSRGRVYSDRLVLEKGLGELDRVSGYRVEALGLRVFAEGNHSSGRVAVTEERKLQALALTGSLRVTAADGTVVALLVPGSALEFAPQAVTGAQAPFLMTGCLERRAGRLVLRDPITGVTEEVRGDRLDRELGRMIEVTATVVRGVQPVEGALEVIQVSRFRRVEGECVLPAAPAAAKPEGAPPPAPAAQSPAAAKPAPAPPVATGGMSGGAKAVIAGVVVGGAGAGAYVYWKSRQNEEPGTISR